MGVIFFTIQLKNLGWRDDSAVRSTEPEFGSQHPVRRLMTACNHWSEGIRCLWTSKVFLVYAHTHRQTHYLIKNKNKSFKNKTLKNCKSNYGKSRTLCARNCPPGRTARIKGESAHSTSAVRCLACSCNVNPTHLQPGRPESAAQCETVVVPLLGLLRLRISSHWHSQNLLRDAVSVEKDEWIGGFPLCFYSLAVFFFSLP